LHLYTTANGSNAATDWWSEWEDVSNKSADDTDHGSAAGSETADDTDLGHVAGPETCDNLRLMELPLATTSDSSLTYQTKQNSLIAKQYLWHSTARNTYSLSI